MLKRSLEESLSKWKTSPLRKPLIIRGARQVGKTSLVRQFGADHFEQIIEINLEKKDHFSIFDKATSVEDFLKRVSLFFDQKIVPHQTLLFIDEIQESQNVMELLRFFAEERPDLPVITAGSLLEAKIGKDWSIPVGRVDYAYLYPMTFFEYLRAKGKNALLEELQALKINDEFEFGDLTNELFKEYITIGGMPEVVQQFVQNESYDDVQAILNRLHTAYIDDIRKYATTSEENKYIEQVVENGPKVAGSVFTYEGFGGSLYRSREMSEAVRTVEKIMLLKQVQSVNSTALPISPKSKRPKKMIWLDVGIVNFVNHAYQDLILGEYKGKIMEQIVGQALIAGGINQQFELYYWAKDRKEGSAEVDFYFQHHSNTIGMEIKSGSSVKMKSLFSLGNENQQTILIRTSWDPLKIETFESAGKSYRVLSLPFYLIDRWQSLVDQFMQLNALTPQSA
jgi:predicted AAA+ superfamily ATPase